MSAPTLKPLGLFGALALAAALVAGPANASVFALVDTGELFTSTDQGATWSVLATLPVSDAAGLIAGTTSQELYLASRSGGVYRSTDGGATWNGVGAVSASDVVGLAGRPDGGLLLLTRSGTVWLSTDQGASFTALGALTGSNLVGLAPGPGGDPFALSGTGEVAQSTDGGATWSVVGAIPVSDAVSLHAKATNLYVLAGTGLTYESVDLGATWTAVGTVSEVGMQGLTVATATGQLLAVSREGLTARSPDGTAWTVVGSVNQLEVTAVANDRPEATTGVGTVPVTTPRIVMAPPRPNPLRVGQTLIVGLSLPDDDHVRLDLFDAAGRVVAERAPVPVAAGDNVELEWNPGILGAGVYFLRVRTDSGFEGSRRVVLLR